MRPAESNSRRVFVLGSGFSATFNLPTLANLFEKVMEREDVDLSRLPVAEVDRLLGRGELTASEVDDANVLGAVRAFYPHFDKHSPPHYPPFEEFLSLLAAGRELPIWRGGGPDLSWDSAVRVLTTYLDRVTKAHFERAKERQEQGEIDVLKLFVARLRPGDTIITFNWDTLIEQELTAQGKSISLLKHNEESIAVFKLHGSLSWVQIPDGTRPIHPETMFLLANRVHCTANHSPMEPYPGLGKPPFIIPPIMSKRVVEEEPLRGIWRSAFDALFEVDQLAFIGYSIPKDDLHARTLLTTAWSFASRREHKDPPEKYSLIDPNPEVVGRYCSILSTQVQYLQSRFSQEALRFLKV